MEWFFRRDDVVQGPLVEEELRRLFERGEIGSRIPVSPNGVDFHPLTYWTAFSADGSLDASRFVEAGAARSELRTDRRTAVIGTDGPYVTEASPARHGKGTAVMGTTSDADSPSLDDVWPGAAQIDPDGASPLASSPTAPNRSDAQDHFFEAISPEPATPPPAPTEPPEPPPAVPFSPSPRAGGHSPAAVVVPPVKDDLHWLPISLAALVALVLTYGGLALADRLVNGPVSSNISRYLPSGASAYLEVPSVRRWGRGISGLRFFRRDAAPLETWRDALTSSSGENIAPARELLEHIRSFALARLGGETLYAVEYDDDPTVDALVAPKDGGVQTKWGPRYTRKSGTACLWVAGERVEICGTGDSLETALEVLDGRTVSAEDDPYLVATKKRGWSSYIPFVTQPGLYSVATPRFTSESPVLGGASELRIKAGIDSLGYFESLDLVLASKSAPPPGATARPTFFDDLPVGTVFYANYRAAPPRTPEQLGEALDNLTALLPHAPPPQKLLDELRRHLGFEPSALFEGLGDEGLIALSAAPNALLDPSQGAQMNGAVWLMQSIDDPGKVRRTLTSLVERLSEERALLSWQDADNLVAEGHGGTRVHVRLEKGRLRVGIGQRKEIERVLAGPSALRDDPAHRLAREQLDPDASVVAWLDLGRLLRDPELFDGRDLPLELRNAIVSEGPERPVAALGVRRFESGDLRVRSLNFPTGLLLLALSSASELTGVAAPFGGDSGRPEDSKGQLRGKLE